VFAGFALLAIIVACLGLFGLAAFTADRRTKEIGIRKVLGASVAGLIVLLSRDFAKLIAAAFVFAAPIAYVAANHWLDEYAYRITIPWRVFLLAGAGALGVALLAVSYQAVRTALADPVDSLRTD
jgi:putative ABC transport system permease protein